MSEDDEAEHPIELGDQTPVEGAPLARVSSRLHWPIEASEIDRREGETPIRSPDGPVKLEDLLSTIDVTYFSSRQEFERHVREAMGAGPVRTAE
ncbi:hypothetical protein Halru_2270 [Halovivax ruber XH-70]|uniref:Uncharacterized protein n=1 Tax=Halovivax ruber (strain DSM 18193 / JCM 13892 / XH-70) TaxID=797302 RepID=L0IF80_HALRX|nr:DUF5789 family protein [Halovivax ruber]AGB16856.1 hypothetical protein Halru_2270 [Halovivax ruber XH-70]